MFLGAKFRTEGAYNLHDKTSMPVPALKLYVVNMFEILYYILLKYSFKQPIKH